jgi:ribonuclease HI
MNNPHAIQVHCDGAMNYDSLQTGGIGFVIDFPDSLDLEPITKSFRSDNQGIHRLEYIAAIEAMTFLYSYLKDNKHFWNYSSGIEIYTDRFSIVGLVDPYKIQDWRRGKWKNHEGVPIKDADLLDKIDKLRKKISSIGVGGVSISFKKRKENKQADKLAKKGKKILNRGSNDIEIKDRRVTRRKYNGPEVDYTKLQIGLHLNVRVYAWHTINDQVELSFEICSGKFLGFVLKSYITIDQKLFFHRTYSYKIEIEKVLKHQVKIILIEENIEIS